MSPVSLVFFNYYVLLGLFAVTWISVGYWFYADSATRGSSYPGLWGLSSVLFWPIGVYYLVSFRRSYERERPPSRSERFALMVAVSGIVATTGGTMLSPPDPISMGLFSILLFGLLVPIMYYVVFGRHQNQSKIGI